MLNFEHFTYFYGLGIAALLVVLFVFAQQKSAAQRAKFGKMLERIAPNFASGRGIFKFILVISAWVLLLVSLANLRKSNRYETVQRQGVDVLIALDISRSMWAQDISPNRMERARQFTLKLIEATKGDRIGLILFAGQAFLQMPMTVDYNAAQLFVRTATPELEITQGTAIEEAIDLSMRLGQGDQQQKQRSLIIVTDGENHEEAAVTKATEARAKGISTFLVAVGTEAGAPIPLSPIGKQGFHTDKTGAIVQSKMNRSLLAQIAAAGGGELFEISEGNDAIIGQIQKRMANLDKEAFEDQSFDTFQTYFYLFAIPALILLILDFLIAYRKW